MLILTISLRDNQLEFPYGKGHRLILSPESAEGFSFPSKKKGDQKYCLEALRRIIQTCLMDEDDQPKPLRCLLKESEGGIVSLQCSEESLSQPFVTVSRIRREKGRLVSCCLETGNLMGSLRFADPAPDPEKKLVVLQINITSRFDGDPRQLFLNYMMSRLQRVDFIGEVGADSDSKGMEVLLAAVFVGRIAAASGLGVFRQYKKIECNDLCFKGRLDLSRHVKQNMPVSDKIAYVKVEVTTDVPINHLLRYAIAKVQQKWPAMIFGNADAKKLVGQILNGTPTWSAAAKSSILNHHDCITPVRHPFYAQAYEDLRNLARLLVQDEDSGLYGERQDSSVSGVVFDGALLWEGYLGSVLEPLGYRHSDPENGIGALDVFKRSEFVARPHHLYPDFYRETEPRRVLDAKYKRGLKRDDILQMLAYVLNTGVRSVGLIYPPSVENDFRVEDGDEGLVGYCSEAVELTHGFGGKILWRCLHYEPIPTGEKLKTLSQQEFEDYIAKQEQRLRIFASGLTGEDC